MCGILGIRQTLATRADAARALQALAWRGPDDQTLLAAGGWWLGVTRLAISDKSAPQPIVCPRTGRIALWNGAVTSAAAEWQEFGPRARTRNDAELLLLRLETHGEQALARGSGHGAGAVLDPRDGTLWFVRDAEREKPLFVVLDGNSVVAFASTAAALQALGLPLELTPAERSRFFRFGFFTHVSSAAPGLQVLDDLRGAAVARGGRDLQPVAGLPPGPATGSLRDRLIEAARRSASAEVPVGLALSGGIDSSCLAAALDAADRHLPAYQFCADGAPTAERALAHRVARRFGHQLVEVGGNAALLRELPWLVRCAGLPLGDPSLLAVHALGRRASQDGIKVLLSGEGSDELFLGYPRHRAARILPRHGLRWLPAPAWSMRRTARLLRACQAPVPAEVLLEATPAAFRRQVLTAPDLPPLRTQESCLTTLVRLDREQYLACDLLPKLDVAWMAAGIEGRCPFLDHAVKSAPEVRPPASARPGKHALRRAFAATVPAAVFRQKKRGFALPLDRWLGEDPWLLDLLAEPRSLARPHLRAQAVTPLLAAQRQGHLGLGHAWFLLAAFELWLRDREAARCA